MNSLGKQSAASRYESVGHQSKRVKQSMAPKKTANSKEKSGKTASKPPASESAGGDEADRFQDGEPAAEDFEKSVEEIEQIVTKLESGELNLTDSLSNYELGIKRLKQCHQLLESAEQKVSLLSGFDADGDPVIEPMPETVFRSAAGGQGEVKAPKQTKPKVNLDEENGLF